MNVKRMTAAALFVLLGMMGAAMAMFMPPPAPTEPQPEPEPAASVMAEELVVPVEKPDEPQQPERDDSVKYWIKTHGDTVAVFSRADMETPVQITSIRVSSLRRDDQDMLDEGIPVTDEESLWMLIEDFGP